MCQTLRLVTLGTHYSPLKEAMTNQEKTSEGGQGWEERSIVNGRLQQETDEGAEVVLRGRKSVTIPPGTSKTGPGILKFAVNALQTAVMLEDPGVAIGPDGLVVLPQFVKITGSSMRIGVHVKTLTRKDVILKLHTIIAKGQAAEWIKPVPSQISAAVTKERDGVIRSLAFEGSPLSAAERRKGLLRLSVRKLIRLLLFMI
ncbi:unnamed protein product [Caretta caretta]